MKMRKLFRTVGLLEAFSFIALIGIAMPLKYRFGMLDATKVPGMVHGFLFLAYIGLAIERADEESWPAKQLILAVLASILPFGTLLFDQKFLAAKNINA